MDGMTVSGDDANDDLEPELPPMPRELRGGSVEPSNRGLRFHGHHTKQFGRQVQSSPARPGNTRDEAIEIDLTPRPVQRQLFPSPESLKNRSNALTVNMAFSTEGMQIPTFVRRSPRLNKVRDVFNTTSTSSAYASVGIVEKENVVPIALPEEEGHLEIVFNGDGGLDEIMPPPSTPKRRSDRLMFKTPGKTPSRDFGIHMSPNVQRTPGTMRTPGTIQSMASKLMKEMQKSTNPNEMTPFSRSLHEALYCNDGGPYGFPQTPSPAGSKRSNKKTPAKSATKNAGTDFDFPDLPSLKGSSPMGIDLMRAFDFSELTTDHLNTDFNDVFSTDMHIPSSPPQSYFTYDKSKGQQETVWADMALEDNEGSTYPSLEDTTTIQSRMDHSGLRRSPRRHAA